MERATKVLVLVWVAAALAVEAWLLRGAWPRIVLLAPIGFVAAAALTVLDPRGIALVLSIAYVLPALLYRYLGPYYWPYSTFWMVLLLGAMMPDLARTGWRVPPRWRGALVCWALVVVAGASIVVAREVDFTPELFGTTNISNTGGGGWPAFVIMWALHAALVLLIGILWFDWLLGLQRDRFHITVAMPLALSALVLAAVAIYQLFIDMSFLNATVYLSIGRASGTVFDANVCGTIAALWVGGAVLWADPFPRARAFLLTAGVLICWLAVWASGSRSAFAGAAIATAFVLRGQSTGRVRRIVATRVAAAAIALCALLLVLATIDVGAIGPLARFRASLPSSASVGAVGSFLAEQLWNRNRYGTISTAMIREYPLFGVGIGSFQMLLPEFAARFGGSIPPDNAQNWYRHQLAEFGIVGSLGWIAWLAAFGAFVLRRRPDDAAVTWSARGALVAFAAISFVGMSGQDIMVVVTFWTIAAWYVALMTRNAQPEAPRPSAATWAIVAGVVFTYGLGTLYAAMHDLRVPARAQRGGWPYMYGFYPPERGIGDDDYRWTARRGVAVIEAPTRWVELTASVDYRAIAQTGGDRPLAQASTRPVDLKIWRDGELVLHKELTTTAEVATVVRVPDGEKWVFIETWVSRIFKAREFGVADDRELGMLLRWKFIDTPAIAPAP